MVYLSSAKCSTLVRRKIWYWRLEPNDSYPHNWRIINDQRSFWLCNITGEFYVLENKIKRDFH